MGEREERGGEAQRACGCGAWWHGCGFGNGWAFGAVVGVGMVLRVAENMGYVSELGFFFGFAPASKRSTSTFREHEEIPYCYGTSLGGDIDLSIFVMKRPRKTVQVIASSFEKFEAIRPELSLCIYTDISSTINDYLGHSLGQILCLSLGLRNGW